MKSKRAIPAQVQPVVNQISFPIAFKIFASTLKKDKELYYAYQSNIAMAFQDAVTGAGYRFPDLHKLANDAAKNFLNLLITKSSG